MTHISDSKAENLVKGFRGIENGEFDIGAISHLHFGKPDEFIFDAVTRFNVYFFIFKYADSAYEIVQKSLAIILIKRIKIHLKLKQNGFILRNSPDNLVQ